MRWGMALLHGINRDTCPTKEKLNETQHYCNRYRYPCRY